MSRLKLTAVDGGKIQVLSDDGLYSEHTTEREAAENASEALDEGKTGVHYVINTVVRAELVEGPASPPDPEPEPEPEPEPDPQPEPEPTPERSSVWDANDFGSTEEMILASPDRGALGHVELAQTDRPEGGIGNVMRAFFDTVTPHGTKGTNYIIGIPPEMKDSNQLYVEFKMRYNPTWTHHTDDKTCFIGTPGGTRYALHYGIFGDRHYAEFPGEQPVVAEDGVVKQSGEPFNLDMVLDGNWHTHRWFIEENDGDGFGRLGWWFDRIMLHDPRVLVRNHNAPAVPFDSFWAGGNANPPDDATRDWARVEFWTERPAHWDWPE